MKAARKHVIVVGLAVWLALFVGSSVALAQLTGGTVQASAGTSNPNPVAPSLPSTATLNAVVVVFPTPPPYCTMTAPTWSWAVDGGTPGVSIYQPNPASPAATLTATFMSPGTYTVSATATAVFTDTCGHQTSASDSTGPIVFMVVGVQPPLQYLQPGGGYVNIAGTLYVLIGCSVTFQAIPDPDPSRFPGGWPVWSGTSGASGTGQTTSVTFSTLSSSLSDYKTVTATCGNTYVTANVIVYDLTPTLTPQDNFAGRDLNTYGVCEYIDLNYQTTPLGITASQIGGLQWKLISGGGILTDNGDGTGTYQCPDVAATISLVLAITGGPCLGEGKAAPAKDVVPPDGIYVEQAPDTGLWHTQGFVDVGFQSYFYCDASGGKIVSFAQIEVREGTCKSTATGYWAIWDKFEHAPTPFWTKLDRFTTGKGYRWHNFIDQAETATITPVGMLANGTFRWPIPNMYRKLNDGGDGMTYMTDVNQEHNCDDMGTANIEKGGSNTFSKELNDPTSNY